MKRSVGKYTFYTEYHILKLEILVEYTISGRDRNATWGDPPEYRICDIESVFIKLSDGKIKPVPEWLKDEIDSKYDLFEEYILEFALLGSAW